MIKRTGRGGARQGAGRKRLGDEPRVLVTCRVSTATRAKILEWSKEAGVSTGQAIDLIIEDYERILNEESEH